MSVPQIIYEFAVSCTATAKIEGHRLIKATGHGETPDAAKRDAQRALEPKIKAAQRKVIAKRRKQG